MKEEILINSEIAEGILLAATTRTSDIISCTDKVSHSRGYFGIGIENGKKKVNIGTLWRSAHCLGASFIFTIGNRYSHQASDTMKTQRHIPLFHYDSFTQFYKSIPIGCYLIGIELNKQAVDLNIFTHPKQAIYLLGAEDFGLSDEAQNKCHYTIKINSLRSLNVSVAGSIIMYDRQYKQHCK